MTREKAKEICEIIETHGIEVIKAYSEGKVIQHLNLDGEWVDCDMPIDFASNHSFRIKPGKSCKDCIGEFTFKGKKAICKNRNCDLPGCDDFKDKEKKYRPFKDFNELMSITGTKLLWVLCKDMSNECLITGNQPHAVYIIDRWYSMQELFDEFEFPDGSPIGKLEEE